jgi:hypothetical protein
LNGRNLAAGLVVGLLVGGVLTYAISGPAQSRTLTATSLATTTLTNTLVSTQDITITTTPSSATTQSSSSIQTTAGYESQVYHTSANGWSFSVILNESGVSAGSAHSTIDVYVNLTSISSPNTNFPQKVVVASPLINPVQYCAGGPNCPTPGEQVWAWNPPKVSLVNMSVYVGQWYFSGPYPISLAGLPQGQYTLSVWPIMELAGATGGGYSLGQSLMINATLGQSLTVEMPVGVS